MDHKIVALGLVYFGMWVFKNILIKKKKKNIKNIFLPLKYFLKFNVYL